MRVNSTCESFGPGPYADVWFNGTIDLLGGFLSTSGGNAINPSCVFDLTGSILALADPSLTVFWHPS